MQQGESTLLLGYPLRRLSISHEPVATLRSAGYFNLHQPIPPFLLDTARSCDPKYVVVFPTPDYFRARMTATDDRDAGKAPLQFVRQSEINIPHSARAQRAEINCQTANKLIVDEKLRLAFAKAGATFRELGIEAAQMLSLVFACTLFELARTGKGFHCVWAKKADHAR